ncbi:MAG: apolipoprotein N-acyltransferase [Candidatus Omnitrophica bacterium]|nr:apolipoprotein N-acyltransferase [Candidatus Omnitrophota bacterium]
MSNFRLHPGLRSLLLCFLSVVLLVFSFPKIDCGPLVWFALVPWMFAIDGKRGRAAFGWSYLIGFLFFFGAFYWVMYVTTVGALLLMAFLALYCGVWGWVYNRFAGRPAGHKVLAYAGWWVVLEYARGHILSGFGWGCLSHSQSHNLALIQIADVTGTYGISFLIIAVNVLIKENLSFVFSSSTQERVSLIRTNMAVVGILLAVYAYGFWRLAESPQLPSMRVAVVQGNIPQEEKWDIANRSSTIEKYLELSSQSLKGSPDIIIWPETAFPGLISEMPELMERIRDFARTAQVPVLIGVVTEEGDKYFNSGLLISAEGEFTGRYDKMHLVPFGEFLPLRRELPFLADIVPIDDFSAGHKPTVFPLLRKGQETLFSVAICFEDTLAYINRRFVQKGAQLLVNITNDAWFQDSKEPFMHLQASVFRTIETRRSLVRAANTGVSCSIDPYGRIMNFLQDSRGKKTYIDGAAVFEVPLNTSTTLYTKLGDIFTYICFLCILWTAWGRRNPKV